MRDVRRCKHSTTTDECTHHEDAGVRCRTPIISEPLGPNVRLVGGPSITHGRIEVRKDSGPMSQWCGICGIGFSLREGLILLIICLCYLLILQWS